MKHDGSPGCPCCRSRALWALLLVVLTAACASRPYQLRNIAKSEIDLVADAHVQEVRRLMRTLMEKLYRRNPDQLAKSPSSDADRRVAQIFEKQGPLLFDELDRKEGADALNLCFDDRYTGDRVFALMAGLVGMVRKSYNDQQEFFIIDAIDQQKLYNSARNIEILVWRLSNRRQPDGRLYLLSNGVDDAVPNLSFERLFGKMIAIQDMMARIMEDRSNRAINRVVRGVASAAFLPVGF